MTSMYVRYDGSTAAAETKFFCISQCITMWHALTNVGVLLASNTTGIL